MCPLTRLTLSASIGTIVNNGNGTFNWSYRATHGPEDSDVVTITARDEDGGVSTATFQLTVLNVAPAMGAFTFISSDPRLPVTQFRKGVLSGTYTDPGQNDTHDLVIDWGDGTTSLPLRVSNGVFSVEHVYSGAGAVKPKLVLTDDDGGSNEKLEEINVTPAAKPAVDLNGPNVAGMNSAVSAALGSIIRIGTVGLSTIFDADSDFLKEVRVAIMKGGAAAAGLFQIDQQSGQIPSTILLSISDGVLTLTAAPGLNGIAPAADFQSALQKIVFDGTSTGAGNASIFIVATDDTDLQGTAQVDVNLVTISTEVPPPEDPTEEIVVPRTFASPPVSLLVATPDYRRIRRSNQRRRRRREIPQRRRSAVRSSRRRTRRGAGDAGDVSESESRAAGRNRRCRACAGRHRIGQPAGDRLGR